METGAGELYLEWIQKRCENARSLVSSDRNNICDAAAILSALLSALAEDFLPRTVNNASDSARFIQLLVDDRILGVESPFRHISLVSLSRDKRLPQIIRDAIDSNYSSLLNLLRSAPDQIKPSVLANTVDQVDEVLLHALLKSFSPEPDINIARILREHSYAHMVYKDLRCAYLHEYRSGDRLTLLPDSAPTGYELAQYAPVDGRLFFSLEHLLQEWIPEIGRQLAANAHDEGSDKHFSIAFTAPSDYWFTKKEDGKKAFKWK